MTRFKKILQLRSRLFSLIMASHNYLHGYRLEEKQRLIQQGQFWQDSLILRDIDFQAGSNLLEVGCGVGAVLGIIGQNYPSLKLAGIDLDATQVEFAQSYLQSLNLGQVDLKVGNASLLPWPDHSFDYVYGIWILEHIKNPLPILQEAFRVLKPGGKIILNEVDLMTLLIYPDSPDYYYLQHSFVELLNYYGNGYISRQLGFLLKKIGFDHVQNIPWSYHYFQSLEVRRFIDYVNQWLSPSLPQMVDKLNKDSSRLESGLKLFQSLANFPESSVTITVYRATSIKPLI